jgi:hypothetical protein
MRIVRVPVFHEGTFETILRIAQEASRCLPYKGCYWRPLHRGRRFAIFTRAPFDLEWVQQRVEDYEFYIYSLLASGHYGADGHLKPRSHLHRSRTGVYRAR